ncbi:MAG: TlpA disulfide reductase family protein [Gammaproteobacteria bacterium]|nr:TlpA disulfide reductase family protein [Gammaproteobacteria bacterium]
MWVTSSVVHNSKFFVSCLLLGMWWEMALWAAPLDTKLKDLDGLDHQLGEYIGHGKWVIFNVWGPKCPPCIDEMPELTAFHDDHHDTDAVVIGLALDFPSFDNANAEDVAVFVDDYFVSFPVLLGDRQIASRIGGKPLRGIPTTFIFSPQGRLVHIRYGPMTQNELENLIETLATDIAR